MTAIYKKELKSYLTSMIGYLFMAFTLALFGLYFTAINLQQGYPEIGYALQNSAFILLIAVPVLTMRVLSEEQKNKTDQLLLTAPVKISDIILGKYLALLTIYVIPVLIMCLYPLLLGTHGTVSYAVSYTSILGYFLLGAAYFGRCVRFLHHRESGHRSRCRFCDPVPVLRGERYRKLLPGRSRKLFLCFLYHHRAGMPLDRQYD